eukprot:gene16826-23106_t
MEIKSQQEGLSARLGLCESATASTTQKVGEVESRKYVTRQDLETMDLVSMSDMDGFNFLTLEQMGDLDLVTYGLIADLDLVSHKQLADLDLVGHKQLADLDLVSHKQLADLDLVGHKQLADLDLVSHKQLADLDLVGHKQLADLDLVSYKQLADLDLVGHKQLVDLDLVSQKQLADLDLVGHKQLADLDLVDHMQLTEKVQAAVHNLKTDFAGSDSSMDASTIHGIDPNTNQVGGFDMSALLTDQQLAIEQLQASVEEVQARLDEVQGPTAALLADQQQALQQLRVNAETVLVQLAEVQAPVSKQLQGHVDTLESHIVTMAEIQKEHSLILHTLAEKSSAPEPEHARASEPRGVEQPPQAKAALLELYETMEVLAARLSDLDTQLAAVVQQREVLGVGAVNDGNGDDVSRHMSRLADVVTGDSTRPSEDASSAIARDLRNLEQLVSSHTTTLTELDIIRAQLGAHSMALDSHSATLAELAARSSDAGTPLPFHPVNARSADPNTPLPFHPVNARSADPSTPLPFHPVNTRSADPNTPLPFHPANASLATERLMARTTPSPSRVSATSPMASATSPMASATSQHRGGGNHSAVASPPSGGVRSTSASPGQEVQLNEVWRGLQLLKRRMTGLQVYAENTHSMTSGLDEVYAENTHSMTNGPDDVQGGILARMSMIEQQVLEQQAGNARGEEATSQHTTTLSEGGALQADHVQMVYTLQVSHLTAININTNTNITIIINTINTINTIITITTPALTDHVQMGYTLQGNFIYFTSKLKRFQGDFIYLTSKLKRFQVRQEELFHIVAELSSLTPILTSTTARTGAAETQISDLGLNLRVLEESLCARIDSAFYALEALCQDLQHVVHMDKPAGISLFSGQAHDARLEAVRRSLYAAVATIANDLRSERYSRNVEEGLEPSDYLQ